MQWVTLALLDRHLIHYSILGNFSPATVHKMFNFEKLVQYK